MCKTLAPNACDLNRTQKKKKYWQLYGEKQNTEVKESKENENNL